MMPYLEPAQNDGVGQSYLRITLRGLQYPASQYNRIEIFCVGRGSYLVGTGGGSSSGEYWTDPRTFSGLSAGSSYSFYAEAQYAAGGRVVRIPDSGYYNFWTLDAPTPSNPSAPSAFRAATPPETASPDRSPSSKAPPSNTIRARIWASFSTLRQADIFIPVCKTPPAIPSPLRYASLRAVLRLCLPPRVRRRPFLPFSI